MCKALSLNQAVHAIDYPTIILLYALMIISAQLRLGGFYTWTAVRIAGLMDRPRTFLLVSMAVAAVLSAILANDIVCLACTPVLCVSLLRAGLNPLPFLLGLALASNIGSAATIIGNPQNMLIGQTGQLGFGAFLVWCAPPSLFAFAGAYLVLCRQFRNRFHQIPGITAPDYGPAQPEFDRWHSGKGLIAILVVVALFFTSIPRELTAVAAAGLLLCSRRMRSRRILELVDWHLITLFCALFVIIRAVELAGLPRQAVTFLAERGINLNFPPILTVISTLMSNLVSNVPATMLLTRFLDPARPVEWYTLAVSSTFAGNLLVIGSIANLIVIEQAAACGVRITFSEHARTGIPVTLLSLVLLVVWIFLVP